MKKRDVKFLFEIGSLRYLQRTWRQFFGSDVANNSEHMFRVAWIALVIARGEKITSEEKILKIALVHDIAESRSLDTNYVTKAYSSRDEERAMKDMLGETSFSSDFIKLFKEYEKRESIESKIVKDADLIDVDLEIQEQFARGSTLRKLWIPRRTEVYNSFYTKTAKKLWKELYNTDPNLWHIEAFLKNRRGRQS